VGGYSLFNNSWGNKPHIIDPKLDLCWASQNIRGVIPKEQNPKLALVIETLMKIQVGIVGLIETKAEWNIYANKQQYAKVYRPMATASIHSFSSSSEVVEGIYFKMGGTLTTALDRWTHIMHRSGKDKTGAGRWSWFTVIGKNNTK
jgi:hypothetical protein